MDEYYIKKLNKDCISPQHTKSIWTDLNRTHCTTVDKTLCITCAKILHEYRGTAIF